MVVLNGKDRGKEGIVMRVLPKDGKVIVEGVNIAKKHQKADPGDHAGRHHRQGHADRRVERGHTSSKGKPSRLGYRFDDDGKKVRVAAPHGGGASALMADADELTTPHARRASSSATTTSPGPLKEQLGLTNIMQVPRFEKIVVNMGVGRATAAAVAARGRRHRPDHHHRPEAHRDQGPQSIAGFKLREGQSIGAKVTLRGDRMWEFFDRLISVAIPRIRDFRGLPANSWDGRGNYTFGVNEQLIFPEIDYDRVDAARGMDITIVTTAHDRRGGQGAARRLRLPVQAGGRRQRDGSDAEAALGAGQGCPRWPPGAEEVTGTGRTLVDGQEGTDQEAAGASPSTRCAAYTRCRRCGRPRSVYRKFGLCRICLRELVHAGEVPGVTKASW